ncbi:MAG: hypothetical protein L6Q71_05270, partial [Planctomycetes bacterium]|nr:hypothetical protein [Planctomycetota bacterium]
KTQRNPRLGDSNFEGMLTLSDGKVLRDFLEHRRSSYNGAFGNVHPLYVFVPWWLKILRRLSALDQVSEREAELLHHARENVDQHALGVRPLGGMAEGFACMREMQVARAARAVNLANSKLKIWGVATATAANKRVDPAIKIHKGAIVDAVNAYKLQQHATPHVPRLPHDTRRGK